MLDNLYFTIQFPTPFLALPHQLIALAFGRRIIDLPLLETSLEHPTCTPETSLRHMSDIATKRRKNSQKERLVNPGLGAFGFDPW
jgi:hypothetical protein